MKNFIIRRNIEKIDIVNDIFLARLKEKYRWESHGFGIEPKIKNPPAGHYVNCNFARALKALNQYSSDEIIDLLATNQPGCTIEFYAPSCDGKTMQLSLTDLIYQELYPHNISGTITRVYVKETQFPLERISQEEKIDIKELRQHLEYLLEKED